MPGLELEVSIAKVDDAVDEDEELQWLLRVEGELTDLDPDVEFVSETVVTLWWPFVCANGDPVGLKLATKPCTSLRNTI